MITRLKYTYTATEWGTFTIYRNTVVTKRDKNGNVYDEIQPAGAWSSRFLEVYGTQDETEELIGLLNEHLDLIF